MTYRTRAMRSLAEIESVRPLWETWQCHPNSDLDHFLAVCRLRPEEVIGPHVIVVENDSGETVALVAAREERTNVAPSLCYLRAPAVKANVLNLIHEGVLGTLDRS